MSAPSVGRWAGYRRDRLSISESYRCESCVGALRYQSQAHAVLRAFSRHGSRSVAEVVAEPEFRELRIFEPGSKGPFRKHFRGLDGYVQSFYEPTVPSGEVRDGMRCEDLMALTFAPETFDLVLTVRHLRARRAIPAGRSPRSSACCGPAAGICSRFPDAGRSRRGRSLASTSPGPRTRWSCPAVYHNHEYLVYNDFGFDLLDVLDDIGFVTDADAVRVGERHDRGPGHLLLAAAHARAGSDRTSRSDRRAAPASRSMRARLPLR